MANLFETRAEPLESVLAEVHAGRIQLPDFQRDWVWTEESVRELIDSVSRGYPIGSLLFVDTRNRQVQFQARPFFGVQVPEGTEAEKLVLDGQQRLTSLYQALYSNRGIVLESFGRGRRPKDNVARWIYVDIDMVLNERDRSDAIDVFPYSKERPAVGSRSHIDLSTREKEIRQGMFPVWIILGEGKAYDEWGMAYSAISQEHKEKWLRFKELFIEPILTYQLPTLTLGRDCTLDALCQIFEKVNTTGVQLNVFDLLTARFSAQNFDLRNDWKQQVDRITFLPENDVLGRFSPIEFLQVLSLLASFQRKVNDPDGNHAVTCRKKDLLNISLDEYKTWNERIVRAARKVSDHLRSLYIFDAEMVPYRFQILALTFLYAWYEDRLGLLERSSEKLEHWFWSTSLGEYYTKSGERNVAKDVDELVKWIEGNETDQPDSVTKVYFHADRLNSLESSSSAIYRALFALIMKQGALDISTGQRINDQIFHAEGIELRPIFSPQWLKKNRVVSDVSFKSILNLTPIGKTAQKIMGSVGPKEYLYRLRTQLEVHVADIQYRMSSHLISYPDLDAESFNIVMTKRRNEMIRLIESAMGRVVAKR